MNNYIVYILKSKIKQITYVGYTKDIERRLKEHNSGKSRFTSIYKPWEIVYQEEYASEVEARKREKYFKTSAGRRLIKKTLDKQKLPR